MAMGTVVDTHSETIKLDIDQIAHNLIGHLGVTAVALLAGVKDRKLPYRWARSEVRPKDASAQRLIAAHRALLQVAGSDSEHIARLWFIGTNPLLGEVSPVEALREGRIAEVLAAASSWSNPGWSDGSEAEESVPTNGEASQNLPNSDSD